MKVKTLLNKINLDSKQTIRVIDSKVNYFIESTDKKEIVVNCGRSGIVNFEYLIEENCYLINVNKRKER